MNHDPIRIVLTGGPGGGKTSFMRELREADPEARVYLLVPEAATQLISAGLRPGTMDFQRAVIHLQHSLESACAQAGGPGKVLICDRGSIDSLAYWKLLGGEEDAFFDLTGMSYVEHLGRYAGVLHFETAAIDALPHYQRVDLSRPEPPEEAARIDAMCGQLWSRHPRYVLLGNRGSSWEEKASRAQRQLDEVIAPLAISRGIEGKD
jgi:predicted ATPase